MAAFSTLLGPTAAAGNAFVGMHQGRRAGSTFANSMTSSVAMMTSSPSPRIEAVMTTANREPPIHPSIAMLNPSPLIRNRSPMAVIDYKKMEEEDEKMESITAEKLDGWIRESIGEIVRNIGEAPFLVQIFSQGPSSPRLETEKASPASWTLVNKRWDQSNCRPDGVILVEELKDDEEQEEEEASDNDSSNKTWGLVVQARGMECAASCYILNTCRVKSAGGFCTHFCLVRAKCFGETLDKQLAKTWLQGSRRHHHHPSNHLECMH